MNRIDIAYEFNQIIKIVDTIPIFIEKLDFITSVGWSIILNDKKLIFQIDMTKNSPPRKSWWWDNGDIIYDEIDVEISKSEAFDFLLNNSSPEVQAQLIFNMDIF